MTPLIIYLTEDLSYSVVQLNWKRSKIDSVQCDIFKSKYCLYWNCCQFIYDNPNKWHCNIQSQGAATSNTFPCIRNRSHEVTTCKAIRQCWQWFLSLCTYNLTWKIFNDRNHCPDLLSHFTFCQYHLVNAVKQVSCMLMHDNFGNL